jgi:GTP-binding protein
MSQRPFARICFIGRSNVGKSSLINMLTKNSQNIWKTGKTQLINHFLNKQQLVLSRFTRIWLRESIKKNKISISAVYNWLFWNREQLVCAFVLIDIRHEAQTIDIEFMSYMGESEIPFCIIFSRQISKVKINSHRGLQEKHVRNNCWNASIFVTSATESLGKEEVLNIDEVNKIFKKQQSA